MTELEKLPGGDQLIYREAINAFCLAVQQRVGQTDGGTAAMFWSGDTEDKLVRMFVDYVRAERECVASQNGDEPPVQNPGNPSETARAADLVWKGPAGSRKFHLVQGPDGSRSLCGKWGLLDRIPFEGNFSDTFRQSIVEGRGEPQRLGDECALCHTRGCSHERKLTKAHRATPEDA